MRLLQNPGNSFGDMTLLGVAQYHITFFAAAQTDFFRLTGAQLLQDTPIDRCDFSGVFTTLVLEMKRKVKEVDALSLCTIAAIVSQRLRKGSQDALLKALLWRLPNVIFQLSCKTACSSNLSEWKNNQGSLSLNGRGLHEQFRRQLQLRSRAALSVVARRRIDALFF